MKNLVVRSASACLLLLLSYGAAAIEADQSLPGVGGTGGNKFYARCPVGQHLLGFNLRAGDNIDAIQPICGAPVSETQVQVQGEMPRYGGTGGQPAQVICPSASMAVPTPVVLGLYLIAEGIEGKVLNSIDLYCGIVASQQRIPEVAAASYHAPQQKGARDSIGGSKCPPGMIGVGVYGYAGAAVDYLGLICGTAQTNFTAGHTLGKRKKGDTASKDDTAGHTLGKRYKGRTVLDKIRPGLDKMRPGADADTSSAASQGALAEARANVDPAIYDQYVGRYSVAAARYLTISREGNRLYYVDEVSRPGQKLELIPRSEMDFSVQSTEAIIRFNKNGEGRVVSLSILGAQEAMQYWREGEQPVRNPF